VTAQPHRAGDAGTFTVDTVRYQNDQQSGGNHNVYVRIVGPNGQELPPEDVERYFDVQYVAGPGQPVASASAKVRDPYGVQQDAWTTGANTGGPTGGYFDVPMYGGNQVEVWVTPKDVPGNPYAGYGSQKVGPMSMPANHHVNYLVTFRASPGTTAPVTDPATGPAEPATPAAPTAPGAGPAAGAYAPGDVLQVSAPGGLNVREGPGAATDRVGGLADGATLQVVPPPDNGPASRDGWVHVSGPGGTGWVSEQYVRKAGAGPSPGVGAVGQPPPGDGRLLTPDGRPQHYVAGNYTDLGRANDGGMMPHPIHDEAAFRDAVNQDLDRLREMGVDNVRVWAADFPHNPLGNDHAALAARVRIIAEEAAKRGMTVTVDLFDGANIPKDVNTYRGQDAELDARIQTIVGQNAGASNIVWSVGNEIGDPANPAAFADWYTQKANLIRQTVAANGGDTQRPLISLQVTPGALGHPTHGWGDARAAMERVVAASDIISPHFYPTGMPGQLPWENHELEGGSQGTFPQMDYDSLKVWVELANAAGKPVTVGEFSVPRDTLETRDLSEQQYTDMTEAWLRELKGLGIDQVSFWQLAKDDVGHVDPASVDLVVGDNAGDSKMLLERLRGGGWLNA
jgi:hypothetical protein